MLLFVAILSINAG